MNINDLKKFNEEVLIKLNAYKEIIKNLNEHLSNWYYSNNVRTDYDDDFYSINSKLNYLENDINYKIKTLTLDFLINDYEEFIEDIEERITEIKEEFIEVLDCKLNQLEYIKSKL